MNKQELIKIIEKNLDVKELHLDLGSRQYR